MRCVNIKEILFSTYSIMVAGRAVPLTITDYNYVTNIPSAAWSTAKQVNCKTGLALRISVNTDTQLRYIPYFFFKPNVP